MKLLLVEDNRELSSWLSKLLNQSGYAVEQAFTGEEAAHFSHRKTKQSFGHRIQIVDSPINVGGDHGICNRGQRSLGAFRCRGGYLLLP